MCIPKHPYVFYCPANIYPVFILKTWYVMGEYLLSDFLLLLLESCLKQMDKGAWFFNSVCIKI